METVNALQQPIGYTIQDFVPPSRHAAQRIGLSYEGLFRQATMYKSRNRDTVWYAATSLEWPVLKKAYHAWLDPNNFNSQGQEVKELSDLTKHALVNKG